MNPLSRTLAYAGTAGLTALLAFAAWSFSQPSSVEGFAEVGQPFFPDFDDATTATALTVVDYDSDEKDVQEFSVKQNDDGLWVIPSHHNYPAEAEDRLAKTATSLLGVEKTAVQSRNKDDWKLYGVVDPAAKGTETAEERGTRLTLSDGSDNALVDLIIGNPVEGRDGNYYVREPEKNTTYIAKLDVDLSAKFSDWIEPDLLKINSTDLVKIVLDNYSVDEQRGVIEKKELLEFSKADLKTSGDWTLAELNEDAEELDKSPVTSIASNLDQLKIVGVRPKPEGLDDNLRINPAVKQILQMQMQAQGYFIGGDKDGRERLYANEGELIAGASNGVEYTLYFGEIARGTGKDIEVGLSKEEAANDEKKDADESESEDDADTADADSSDEEDGPRRYLMVKAAFNESLLGPKPVAPTEPVKPAILEEETKPEDKEGAKAEAKDAAKKEEPKKEEAPEEKPTEEKEAPQEEATESEESDADDSCGFEDEPEEQPSEEEPAADEPAADEPAPEAEKEKADDKPEPAAETKKEEAAAEKKPDEKAPSDEKKSDDSKADKPDDKKTEPAAKADKEDVKPESKKADTEAPAAKSDKEEAEPEVPEKDPKQIAQEAYDVAKTKYDADKRKFDTDLKAYEDKVKQGKEKAEELSRRFSGWYYVISSDSFEKFRITRNDVVSKKEAKEDTEATTDEAKK